MSTDYAQKERAFIASLETQTGADLDGWMQRIRAQNLPHRNDIIDWLRAQGFVFAKASWLERIYANGGKPIYPEPIAGSERKATRQSAASRQDGAAETEQPTASDSQRRDHQGGQPPAAGSPAGRRPFLRLVVSKPPVAPTEPGKTEGGAASEGEDRQEAAIEATLAMAKGLRPLARLILDKLAETAPGLDFTADGPAITAWCTGGPVAVLVVQPKELRLGLNRSGLGGDARLQPARLAVGTGSRFPDEISHMCVLDDARQIDSGLILLMRQAAEAAGAGQDSGAGS